MRYIVLLLFPLFSCDDTKLIDVERLNTFEGYHNHFMQQRLSKITITDHISGNYEEMNWEWESWLNATVFRTTNGSRDLYKQLLYNEYGYLMREKEYWDGSFCQQNLFDAWKVLSNVCVDNGDTLIQDYNWGVDRLTVIGPNGRKRYNDYGLVVGIYDEILSSWVNNDISENGRRYLTERDILDCNGKRIIIEKNKCKIIGDKYLKKYYRGNFTLAKNKDWSTEYLDSIISVKCVENLDNAIEHINKYGTMHTDSIITKNKKTANKFLKNVKSSIAMHNTSTQFADGGEFGFGGEIGISTNKLPPRGPVGLEQLVSYKYEVIGKGQIRK